MPETEDPRATLVSGDISTKAAAARDLLRDGGWADVELLLSRARVDKSPSVRLYAAAAASEILFRIPLDAGQCVAVRDMLRGHDPGDNPSVLAALGALPDDAALDTLGRLLRDPRNGVRAGVVAALRRRALRAAGGSDTSLAAKIRQWLESGRVPPDASLDLVKLVGEAGIVGCEASLQKLTGAGRNHPAAIATARERLGARRDVATWQGLWVGSDVDVYSVASVADARKGFALVFGDQVVGDVTGSLRFTEGGAVVGDAAVEVRRVWVPTLGDAPDDEVLQVGGLTLRKLAGKDLAAGLDEIEDRVTDPAAWAALAGWLEGQETLVALRTRANALFRAGRLAESATILDDLVARKPKPELLWLVANVKLGLGELDAAREAVAEYLEKVSKKAPHRADAEALSRALCGPTR